LQRNRFLFRLFNLVWTITRTDTTLPWCFSQTLSVSTTLKTRYWHIWNHFIFNAICSIKFCTFGQFTLYIWLRVKNVCCWECCIKLIEDNNIIIIPLLLWPQNIIGQSSVPTICFIIEASDSCLMRDYVRVVNFCIIIIIKMTSTYDLRILS